MSSLELTTDDLAELFDKLPRGGRPALAVLRMRHQGPRHRQGPDLRVYYPLDEVLAWVGERAAKVVRTRQLTGPNGESVPRPPQY